jgi:HAMP domain-containing protein
MLRDAGGRRCAAARLVTDFRAGQIAPMADLVASLGWGLVIAASLVAGALAAALLCLPAMVAASLTAFGGGILLAAIALELVPEADREAGPLLTAAGLVAGTLIYVAVDTWLTRDGEAIRRSAHAAAAGRPMAIPARGPQAPADSRSR